MLRDSNHKKNGPQRLTGVDELWNPQVEGLGSRLDDIISSQTLN